MSSRRYWIVFTLLQIPSILLENATCFLVDNLTSAQHYDDDVHLAPRTNTVIYGVVWPILIITGIIGNILSLVVLRKTNNSNTTSKLLQYLAVADTMSLIFRGTELVHVFGNWSLENMTWTLSSRLFIRLFYQLADRISKYVTVAIAIERVIAVTKPFHYKFICKPIRIVAIITIICIILVSASIPDAMDIFMYYINAENSKTTHMGTAGNKNGHRLSLSNKKAIFISIGMLFFDFLPFPIVMVSNVIIVVWLWKGRNAATVTTQLQQRKLKADRELTKLLLTISILFLILCCPFAIRPVVSLAGMNASKEPRILKDILSTLILVNSSINFVVYSAMNKKYREGYITILRCFRRRNVIQDSHGIELQVVNGL